MTELIALAALGRPGDPTEAEGLGTDEVDLPVDVEEVLESDRATGPVLIQAVGGSTRVAGSVLSVELPAQEMGTVTPRETGGAPGAPAGWRQDGVTPG